MSNIFIEMSPLKSAVLSDHCSSGYMLLRIKTPVLEQIAETRAALNLSLVLDRSGSMSGRPLKESKNCAEQALDYLEAEDRVSLVTYHSRVEQLSSAIFATDENKALLRRLIRLIEPGGATDLHGGWREGAETLLPFNNEKNLSRVILLSDGRANVGLTEPEKIVSDALGLQQQGVTTSTYGLGREFNEDLMVRVAEASGGNSYYGEKAEDLIDPFRQEFELMQALTHRNVRLGVTAADGVELQLLNQFFELKPEDSSQDIAHRIFAMKDMVHGSEAWALFRYDLKSPPSKTNSSHDIFSFNVSYQDQEGKECATETSICTLPVVSAAVYGDLLEDELVRNRVSELEAAQIQAEAREAALKQDWDKVEVLLNQARVKAVGNEWLTRIVEGLEYLAAQKDNATFAKEAHYSSKRLHWRAEATQELEDSLQQHGQSMPSYFRKKSRQGKRE